MSHQSVLEQQARKPKWIPLARLIVVGYTSWKQSIKQYFVQTLRQMLKKNCFSQQFSLLFMLPLFYCWCLGFWGQDLLCSQDFQSQKSNFRKFQLKVPSGNSGIMMADGYSLWVPGLRRDWNISLKSKEEILIGMGGNQRSRAIFQVPKALVQKSWMHEMVYVYWWIAAKLATIKDTRDKSALSGTSAFRACPSPSSYSFSLSNKIEKATERGKEKVKGEVFRAMFLWFKCIYITEHCSVLRSIQITGWRATFTSN